MEEKVNAEIAQNDFLRLVDAAEVDVDGMSEQELAEFEETKRKFIRHIQTGKMTVDDDGLPSIRLLGTEVPELKFRVPYTDTIIAQGRVLNGNDAAKARAMLAEATGVPAKMISRHVTAKDFILAQRILGFFLDD
jgi:nicotinic acid phosphoribosyltransferase